MTDEQTEQAGPTPAPWTHDRSRECDWPIILEIGGMQRHVAWTTTGTPLGEAESNAALIASSCNAVQAAAESYGIDPLALARAMEHEPERLAAAYVMRETASRDAFGAPIVRKKDTTHADT